MGAYEFGAADEAIFLRLASSTRVMAFAGLALTALLLVAGGVGLVHPPAYLPPRLGPALGALLLLGAPPAAYASWRLKAASAELGRVVSTSGRDVPLAVAAGAALRDAFRALAVMLLLHVGVALTVLALGLPRGA